MYTLYYSPGACSMAVHIALIEMQAEFTLASASIAEGKNRTPEYLAINPRGSVPALVEDGRVLREGAATMITLAEKYKSPLLPASGLARAEAIEWLCFCNATLHPAYARVFFLRRNGGLTEPQQEVCYAAIKKLWKELEERFARQAYLAGEQCTLADILMTVIANWGEKHFPGVLVFGENTKRVLKAVVSRPSFQQAMAAEGTSYLVAL